MPTQTNILLESGTNELEVAEFSVKTLDEGDQYFGINVSKVKEIIRRPKIIKVPYPSPFIEGIFNLRDEVVPIINLPKWLGYKADVTNNSNRLVIVAEFNRQFFGFLVDSVERIHRMSWEKILPPGYKGEKNSKKTVSITGILQLEDKIVMMIDFEKIVADINPDLGFMIDEHLEKIADDEVDVKSILIAEDSALIRQMLKDTMEKGGMTPVIAENGKLAWDILKKTKAKCEETGKSIQDYFSMLVTDIEMPQMDGYALTKLVKEDPTLKGLPVVIFSTIIYDEIRHKGEAVGADEQISKPELGSLVDIAKKYVRKYASQTAAKAPVPAPILAKA